MRKRYLGIVAFTLLTGVIFVSVFQFLDAWEAVSDRLTAVMVIATFFLAAAVILFRFLTAGREWDLPGDTAFTAAALVTVSRMFPWGVWLLVMAIPIGGLVTFFRLLRVSQTRNARNELAYTVVLLVQFVLILAALVWLGFR